MDVKTRDWQQSGHRLVAVDEPTDDSPDDEAQVEPLKPLDEEEEIDNSKQGDATIFGGSSFIQSGVVNFGTITTSGDYSFTWPTPAASSMREDSTAERKRSFLFDFYSQALKQSETTFRMSLIFMSLGALTILTGGCLALLHASTQGNHYAATISGISGAVIGVCGTAFAIQANRARKHLTQQADKIYKNLSSERSIEQALDILSGIQHQDAQDRLRAIATLRALGIEPPASTVTQHLMQPRSDSESERSSVEE